MPASRERDRRPGTNRTAQVSTATKTGTIVTEIARLAGSPHSRFCDATCTERTVTSPLERDRPPAVACPWCGAPPLMACTIPGRRLPLTVAGRFHPSRLEVAS